MNSLEIDRWPSNTLQSIVVSAVTAKLRASLSPLARTIDRTFFAGTALSATKSDSIKSPAGAGPIAHSDINR
jgi:hypothetical protein